jgi:hypothetical protein
MRRSWPRISTTQRGACQRNDQRQTVDVAVVMVTVLDGPHVNEVTLPLASNVCVHVDSPSVRMNARDVSL